MKIMRVVLVGLALFMSGCGDAIVAPPVVNRAEIGDIVAPEPQPVDLPRLTFRVLNQKSLSVVVDQQKANPDFVIYAIDYKDLDNLINALNSTAAFISEKNAQVEFYKSYLLKLKDQNQQKNDK